LEAFVARLSDPDSVTGADRDDELAAEVFALVDYHFIKPVSAEALVKVLRA
jgi:hypothetical protein